MPLTFFYPFLRIKGGEILTRIQTYHKHPRRRFPIRPTKRGWAVLAILLAVIILLVSRCTHRQPEAIYPENIGTIPVHTDLIPEDFAGRTGIERDIKWIVIHETGNRAPSATAANHNAFLHDDKLRESKTAWHYTVDDHEIYHHLPDDEVGYQAGDGQAKNGGNLCGIGIEICVNEGGDYDQAVDNAAMLTAYLLNAYHLGVNDVKQHADFMQKNCPEHLREGDNWTHFLQKVKEYKKQLK